MYGYLIAALVVAFMVGGAGYKGYNLGQDNIRTEWQAATIKAKEEADAERQRLQDSARQQAGNLQKTLAKEKALKNDLSNALQAHIRAMPKPPAGCPAPELSPGLLDLWQRANEGPDGAAGGKLPSTGGTVAAPDKTRPGSGDSKPH